MRDFHLVVPRDCVASNNAGENEHALRQMERVLDAVTASSGEIDLRKLAKR